MKSHRNQSNQEDKFKSQRDPYVAFFPKTLNQLRCDDQLLDADETQQFEYLEDEISPQRAIFQWIVGRLVQVCISFEIKKSLLQRGMAQPTTPTQYTRTHNTHKHKGTTR